MFSGHKKDYTNLDIYQFRYYPAYHQQLIKWFNQENSSMLRATLRTFDQIRQEWALYSSLPQTQGTTIVERLYHRQYIYTKKYLFSRFNNDIARKLNYVNNKCYRESVWKLYAFQKSLTEKKLHRLNNFERRLNHERLAAEVYRELEEVNPSHPLLVVNGHSVFKAIQQSMTTITEIIVKLKEELEATDELV
jgi:hypothetical protein